MKFLSSIPLIIPLLFCCFFSPPEILLAQETIEGEIIDSAQYGKSFVESMEAALARNDTLPNAARPSLTDKHGQKGSWKVPSRGATSIAHSGEHYVTNKWGDTRMGIAFPGPVNFHGAYICGQSAKEAWTTGIRVVGYRQGKEVMTTPLFRGISIEPQWMAMELQGVDRIEVVAVPVLYGSAWYGMDDLTFTPVNTEGRTQGEKVVVDFDNLSYNTTLTGSNYAGLIWEEGAGIFLEDEGIHSPKSAFDRRNKIDSANMEPPLLGLSRGTLPTLVATHQGVIRGDAGSSSYPPDTDGAIGPNHYVETVNRNFAVYDKSTGAELISILLGAFLPGSNGDPRVVFDHHSDRWIVTVPDFDATASIFIAVSTTDDPTGSWFKTSFVMGQGSDAGAWPDYPTLGVDANGIYMAAYMVGSGGMSIFAVDKAPLIGAIPYLGTVTAFRGLPYEDAIQPAHTYGTPAGQYCISIDSFSTLRLRRINPPMTAPTLTNLGTISVPSFSDPPNAPALGSSVPLATVSARLMMSVYRNGSIWTAHTIDVSGRAACRWYEIDVNSLSVVQYGTAADSSLNYFFPSIMVNNNGDAVMGFSGSDSSQYAGCYYTGRISSDPAGEMATPFQYKVGTAAQNNIDTVGRNRWGDYSYTTLDPTDESRFWTIQEYGHSNDIWGTYMAVVNVEEPALSISLIDTIPSYLNPGLALDVEVEILNGAENYQPGSGTLHYRFDGGSYLTVPLVDIGGNSYVGTVPNTRPGDSPEFYFSAQGNGGTTVTLPQDAPSGHFAFDVYFHTLFWEDDFEIDQGWTVTNGTISTGAWERGDPVGTGAQPGNDHTPVGVNCYVTGRLGGGDGDYDVDGGPTRLLSPNIDLSSGDGDVGFYLWFYHTDYGGQQPLEIHVSNNGGSSWIKVTDIFHNPTWAYYSFKVSDYITNPSSQVKVRFMANDTPNDDLVEAALDDFEVSLVNTEPELWADAYTISTSAGGTSNFSLDAGVANANRTYLILGTLSGTSPGLPLPGGLATLPVNWDAFTNLVVGRLNTSTFTNFYSALDGQGEASAQINTAPLSPAKIGQVMHYAFLLDEPFDTVSNAIGIEFVP